MYTYARAGKNIQTHLYHARARACAHTPTRTHSQSTDTLKHTRCAHSQNTRTRTCSNTCKRTHPRTRTHTHTCLDLRKFGESVLVQLFRLSVCKRPESGTNRDPSPDIDSSANLSTNRDPSPDIDSSANLSTNHLRFDLFGFICPVPIGQRGHHGDRRHHLRCVHLNIRQDRPYHEHHRCKVDIKSWLQRRLWGIVLYRFVIKRDVYGVASRERECTL